MSQSATAARVQTRPAARPGARPRVPQPRLRVVAPAPRRSRAGLALLCVTMLGLGLLLLLMLNISLGRGSYQIYAQQAQLEQLHEQRQALREDLDARRAPQQLAEQAVRLGMVPSGNPAYLRLSDGKVFGTAQRAARPPAKKPAAKKSDASDSP
jgi:hypothetical protein